MLKPNPEERIQIDGIMANNWINKYNEVPQTELITREVLQESELAEINNSISAALAEQRNDNEEQSLFLPLTTVNNDLLNRRLEKNPELFNQKN